DGCARLPRIAIKLHYSRGHSTFGGPCTHADVTARLRGDDSGLIVQSDFTVNGVAIAPITVAPFQVTVPLGSLDARHHARVHVKIEMFDGRELTLSKTLPPRCS